MLDLLHEEEVVARSGPELIARWPLDGGVFDDAFGVGRQGCCRGCVGVDGAVAGARDGGVFGGEFGEGGFHLHELGGETQDVAFGVLGEPGGGEVADLGPDLVVDDVEFGKLDLVAGKDTFAAQGFDQEGPLGGEA